MLFSPFKKRINTGILILSIYQPLSRTCHSKGLLTRKIITLSKYFGWHAWPKRRGSKLIRGLSLTPGCHLGQGWSIRLYTRIQNGGHNFSDTLCTILYTLSYIVYTIDLYYTLWHLVSAWSLPFVFNSGFLTA